MTKVKIFSNVDAEELERSINEFCRDKKVIDIKYQVISIPTKTNENGAILSITICDRVLITYEENDNED